MTQPKKGGKKKPTTAQLVDAYNKGSTLLQLVEQHKDHNLTYRNIRTRLLKHNVTIREAQRVTPPAPPSLLRDYSRGMSIKAAAENQTPPLSYGVARRMLINADAIIRPPGGNH